MNKINKEVDDDLQKARLLCQEVSKLCQKYNLEYFFVTEGASCCHIKNNEAIRNARHNHEKWETTQGFDSKEDWSDEIVK